MDGLHSVALAPSMIATRLRNVRTTVTTVTTAASSASGDDWCGCAVGAHSGSPPDTARNTPGDRPPMPMVDRVIRLNADIGKAGPPFAQILMMAA